MRFVQIVALSCLAAQANAALVSVTDGTTITVSACEPMSFIALSHTTTTDQVSAGTTSTTPGETSTEGSDDTGGAMSRPVERSMAGLIAFLVVSLAVL